MALFKIHPKSWIRIKSNLICKYFDVSKCKRKGFSFKKRKNLNRSTSITYGFTKSASPSDVEDNLVSIVREARSCSGIVPIT
jgi:hypothetical protein